LLYYACFSILQFTALATI